MPNRLKGKVAAVTGGDQGIGHAIAKRLSRDVAGVAGFLTSSDSDCVTGTTFFLYGGLLWNYQEQ